ncbi:SRPBCC domain-containing protein [Conexibacter stalactiti]|uniref:SRPBCC domain-containing protein n=1 Tax=Conexibacter stalactiti TaxID=1940611 RepID=A0ABU4HZK1_9ACTN|nr:SRPBCC domain-containing protein [Conexibacter stalactiti]MDW5598569.1 SRPBCC domain-containing protein [Conexibacter stalactiti]MEC5039211.1 SRPBCC domain-containing protein [Conexibacter stalactiti]
MIDVSGEISAVRRQLGSRVLEAGEARVSTISRSYETTLDDLWEACTDGERIRRWFMPVSGELKLGGRFQLEGNAGGTIERCDPPNGFDATWEYGGEVSWIELRLTAEAQERTRLTLEHIAHVDDERWNQYGPGAVGIGWELGLLGLTLHLRAGAVADVTAEGQEWAASEEGRRFMALSGEAWGEAAIAGGEPAEAARAASARTIAFYTGG